MTAPEVEEAGWQRLDPRMLLVHPLRELVRFLPVLFGVFVAGTASGRTDWWHALGVAVPMGLGVLRYVTTSFRITGTRVELRRGLLARHLLSTPIDRVRTVDVTATLTHRVLGLTTVRIGTGTASTDEEDHLDLDGLPVARARRLRALLLETPALPADASHGRVVVRIDPTWVRFAPLTTTGLVLAGAFLGLSAQALNTVGGFARLDAGALADSAADWSVWVAAPIGVLLVLVAVSLLAIGGYAVTNWGFTLSHTRPETGGSWHLRRGLLTTHETTLDDHRVSGVSLAEPLGLRLARGARLSAVVTGVDRERSGSSLLAPPCPALVARQVAADVLASPAPLAAPLSGHGPRARRRRYIRALGPACAAAVGAVLLVVLAGWPPAWLGATVAVPLLAVVARDRAEALGHALVEDHVVARSGSLQRRHDALAVRGVIGWNLRSSWFQRRAGLTTLLATTAGGRGAVAVPDVPEDDAVALALEAMPDLLEQFLSRGTAGS